MKHYTITMTPQIAEEWLKANTRNRPVKEAHVRHLAREMAAGRWKENGESIKRNGTALLDGQHRLLACVKCGKPFRTLVVEGLPSDVFDTIDQCVPRSGSDTLAVMGEKNTKRLSAALGLLDKYITGRMAGSVKYSNADIEELLLRHPGIRSSTERSDLKTRLLPPALASFLHYIFSQKDPALADQFMDQVLRGKGLSEGQPVYLLRERLVDNSLAKAKLSPAYIAALAIKAWNFTRAGKSITYLRFRDRGEAAEAFPIAV